MMTAAVVSNRWVPRIRPAGRRGSSSGLPLTSGITATPVSNPDRPSASFGNTISATATIITGLGYAVCSAARQSTTTCGCATMCSSDTAITTVFSARYTATSTTAIPMASLNPLRNTAASSATSTRVMPICWPRRKSGRNGFSRMCAVASAAESVMVMMKSVAAKPSRTSTNSLPDQRGRIRSSMAIDPWPSWLSRATQR